MAITEDFRRKVRKIDERQWSDVRDIWLNYPDAAAQPGFAPESELEDLPELKETLKNIKVWVPEEIEDDIPGLRRGLLKQSFFFLQRAAYLLLVANRIVDWKCRTPGSTVFYDSAFMACRGTVALLGVTAVALVGSKKHFLLDVCGSKIPGTAKLGLKRNVLIVDTGGHSIDHQEWWFLLQRLLDKTRVHPISVSVDVVSTIQALNPAEFADQRNRIQHRAAYWPFDDIRQSWLRGNFVDFSSYRDLATRLADAQTASFSVLLAHGTIQIGLEFLKDLCRQSGSFEEELQCATSWQECVFDKLP